MPCKKTTTTLLWTENEVVMKLKKKRNTKRKRKSRSLLRKASPRMLSAFLCSEIKVFPRNRIFMSTELLEVSSGTITLGGLKIEAKWKF